MEYDKQLAIYQAANDSGADFRQFILWGNVRSDLIQTYFKEMLKSQWGCIIFACSPMDLLGEGMRKISCIDIWVPINNVSHN